VAFTPSGTQVANQFSVDGTTFSVDALNNRVGLGIAVPTSNFHNNGTTSFTVSPTSSTATDTTVLLRNTNVTLPAASTCTGRMYIIRNTNTSGSITISGGTNSMIIHNSSTGANNATLTSAIGTMSFISNGSVWYQIN